MTNIKRQEIHVSKIMEAAHVIADFSTAVEEVVLNSIEADATLIRIGLELTACHFSVQDNGTGIHPIDLAQLLTEYHGKTILLFTYRES